MYGAMLHHPERERFDTSSLAARVSGWAAMPVGLMRGFEDAFACKVLEGYGLSETSPGGVLQSFGSRVQARSSRGRGGRYPADMYREEVGAAVALMAGATATPEGLREYVKEQVAAYKDPRLVWFVEELPKGPTGKILKRQIERPSDLTSGAAASAAHNG